MTANVELQMLDRIDFQCARFVWDYKSAVYYRSVNMKLCLLLNISVD